MEKELQDGTFLIPDSTTVAELLEKWVPIQSSKHKWAPKTYTHTTAMIQNLIVPYIGHLPIQNVRTYDLEQFYATLSHTPKGLYIQGKKQKLSAAQQKRFLTAASIREVHALLKQRFPMQWSGTSSTSLRPSGRAQSHPGRTSHLDEHTMLAALQTIENPALHLAVHLSMILSLRAGEILGLQPEDIDFGAANGRGTISISKTLQRTDKVALEKTDPSRCILSSRPAGRQHLFLDFEKPKTRKSNRVLYLTKP